MRRDSRGDNVERDAHRSRKPADVVEALPLFGGELAGDEPLPDAKPLAHISDTDWLAGANDRIARLTPLSKLQEATLIADQTIRDLSMRPPWHDIEIRTGAQPHDASAPAGKLLATTASERAQKRAQKGLGAVLKKNPPKGLARDRDHATSLDAALAIEPRLSDMQEKVLRAFRAEGAMTDEQLERLGAFNGYKYSTARKRRTELVTKGLLASCGKAMNSSGSARMTLWDLTERVKPEKCANCGALTFWQNGHQHPCAEIQAKISDGVQSIRNAVAEASE